MEQTTNSTPTPEVPNPPQVTEQEAETVSKRFKLSKKLAIIMLGVLVLVGVISYFIYANKAKEAQSPSQTSNNQSATPTLVKTSLTETNSIDTLNPSALIKTPFVRDGNIYLYEDGKEKLVAKPAQKTTQQACYSLAYPFLSDRYPLN